MLCHSAHTHTREPTLTLSYRADGSVRLNAAAQRCRDKVSCHNDRLLFPGAGMTERSRHCCVLTSYWICVGQPKKYSILSFCFFFQTNQSESRGNASDKRWGGGKKNAYRLFVPQHLGCNGAHYLSLATVPIIFSQLFSFFFSSGFLFCT